MLEIEEKCTLICPSQCFRLFYCNIYNFETDEYISDTNYDLNIWQWQMVDLLQIVQRFH